MAPHVQRDYHNTGDPSRYSLRTLKHGENNFPCPRDVDVSKINGKEDFFRCLGLQMRRFTYEYRMPNGGYRIKKINIPNGVTLRDCSVVILGSMCELCDKCFKCETDLNVHYVLKHQTDTKIHATIIEDEQCGGNKIDRWKTILEPLDRAKVTPSKNVAMKLHKKLRLILRIGNEIVAKISVKRKHLKGAGVDTCTQTEVCRGTELIIGEDECEDMVSCIDPPVFGKSPCQCCNSSVHVVNSPNQYVVSNIVASKQTLFEESIAQEGNHVSDRPKESRTTTINENYCAVHHVSSNTIPLVSNSTVANKECNSHQQNDIQNSNLNKLYSPIHIDNALMFNETYCNSRCTETSKQPIFDCNNKNDGINSLANNTDNLLERNVQSCPKDSNKNKKEKDINENEIQVECKRNINETVNCENLISNMVQVIVPVILPIIVPNKDVPSSPLKLTIQSAPLQQQKQQQEEQHQKQKKHQQEQQQKQEQEEQRQKQNGHQEEQQQQEQQVVKTSTCNTEVNPDNEIQEVLRIVRRGSTSAEINHESPTRIEQELLIRDAIRDMKKVEGQEWYLLDKEETMECLKKRKRSMKGNSKSNDTNDDSVKKKKRIMVEPNSEYNVARNVTGEKSFSNTREHLAKIQSYSGRVTMCTSDNVKENLMMCSKTIDIPAEVLQHYGINYYNEVFEINNNAETIQEPVSRFLVPCSIGMENRSNRPTVIDLVNDTDE
ncbi:unnamed protein product [Xylocopa violacea]|uniref:C2H2-type domain-containing protein n=1 Tax=Xylocopa violacea TaxID=135666 RepID=A0ABP1NWS0_XYLVO